MDQAKAEAKIPSRSPSAAHAVTALYEAHALGLVRLAVVMTGDQSSAEDIVQDAFLGLYRLPAGSHAGVPPYYVAVANSSLTVVRATWTGATLAKITTKVPVVGVAGAADGRTFVLDEQRSIMGGQVRWVGQPAFYLLRLTASGTEESLTRLAVPAIPKGTVVSGLALSPDGSKLAINVDSGGWPQARLMKMMTYTLATGAFRSWTTSGMTNPEAPFGFTGSG